MDPKETPESKIPTTRINPNKNQTDQVHKSTKKIQPSHLKKNEFALILIGALLLTIVIFFLFFRSSDIRTETVKTNTSSPSFADLEERVEALEKAFEIRGNAGLSSDGSGTGGAMGIGPVKERVASLETAFSVKFDSLRKRMEAMERRVSGSSKKLTAAKTSKPVAKSVAKPAAPVTKIIKAGLFHTIKKGETLYSISKKYNTTVKNIQKLNKLSPGARIYPGDSILVR